MQSMNSNKHALCVTYDPVMTKIEHIVSTFNKREKYNINRQSFNHPRDIE